MGRQNRGANGTGADFMTVPSVPCSERSARDKGRAGGEVTEGGGEAVGRLVPSPSLSFSDSSGYLPTYRLTGGKNRAKVSIHPSRMMGAARRTDGRAGGVDACTCGGQQMRH